MTLRFTESNKAYILPLSKDMGYQDIRDDLPRREFEVDWFVPEFLQLIFPWKNILQLRITLELAQRCIILTPLAMQLTKGHPMLWIVQYKPSIKVWQGFQEVISEMGKLRRPYRRDRQWNDWVEIIVGWEIIALLYLSHSWMKIDWMTIICTE